MSLVGIYPGRASENTSKIGEERKFSPEIKRSMNNTKETVRDFTLCDFIKMTLTRKLISVISHVLAPCHVYGMVSLKLFQFNPSVIDCLF